MRLENELSLPWPLTLSLGLLIRDVLVCSFHSMERSFHFGTFLSVGTFRGVPERSAGMVHATMIALGRGTPVLEVQICLKDNARYH